MGRYLSRFGHLKSDTWGGSKSAIRGGQTYNTQHVEGTTFDVGDYRPELDHLAPCVDADPYGLADVMDDDQGGDGTGRNFPDLYARLVAQEGHDRAAELWGKACHIYDYLRHGPDGDQ